MEQQSNLNNYKYRLLIAGGALICFAFIAYQISTHEFLEFDTAIRETIYGWRNGITKTIFIPVTYMGNWQSLVTIALVLIVIPKTRKNIGIPMAVTAISSTIVYGLIKMIFKRPRPDVSLHLITQGGYSFPSGHSMNGIVFFGILIYLIRKNCKNRKTANILTVLLIFIVFIIGFSRVFVGVHFPTDILGGWSMGIAILMIASIVIDKLEKNNVLQFNK